jgi:acetate kinase
MYNFPFVPVSESLTSFKTSFARKCFRIDSWFPVELKYYGLVSRYGALVAFNYKWTTNKIELYNDKTSKDLQMLNLKIGLSYIIR